MPVPVAIRDFLGGIRYHCFENVDLEIRKHNECFVNFYRTWSTPLSAPFQFAGCVNSHSPHFWRKFFANCVFLTWKCFVFFVLRRKNNKQCNCRWRFPNWRSARRKLYQRDYQSTPPRNDLGWQFLKYKRLIHPVLGIRSTRVCVQNKHPVSIAKVSSGGTVFFEKQLKSYTVSYRFTPFQLSTWWFLLHSAFTRSSLSRSTMTTE